MNDFKLGVKLIGGFSLTAIIILIVGFISIFEQNKLQKATKSLEENALVAVEDILDLKESATEITKHTRILLSPYISAKKRRSVPEEISIVRKGVEKTQENFKQLPFFNQIKAEWEEYISTLKKWAEANNRALALSNELLAADIINPEQFAEDMLGFEAAHKGLINKVGELVLLQTPFEGGTDPTTCSTGKWLSNMPTTNPEIVAEMEKLRPIHMEIHQQVAKIKKLVEEDRREHAQLLLQNRVIPLAGNIFTITAKVDQISKRYQDKFLQMTTILLKEAAEHQKKNFEVLQTLVNKVDEYAHETTKMANETADTGKTVTVICMVAGTILALLLGCILTVLITRPLSKGVELARSMAAGDITQSINVKQKDEIGILAASLNNMATQLRSMLVDINAEVKLVTQSSTDLAAISAQMATGAENTAKRSSHVSAEAEGMSSNQNSVAAAMEQASINVTMVASATEEMKSTITEISENSGRAKTITNQAVEKSQIASERVDELGLAAHEINKVTETITEISEQTNLLALNATIEAARAGEAGKGFAVVANEIKDLAGQTAKATLDIQEKIQGIQRATGTTVNEINDISNVITEIDQVVSTIAEAVEEQSATTGEIVDNVTQVSEGIAEVNGNVARSTTAATEIAADISEVNNSANEITKSSKQVKEMAANLSTVANKLQDMVHKFKV